MSHRLLNPIVVHISSHQYDLDDDDKVNFKDLQRLSSVWLNCADPENPDCMAVP
jgi:hypothetical protein